MSKNITTAESVLATLSQEAVQAVAAHFREEVTAELVGRLQGDVPAPAARKRRVAKPKAETAEAKAETKPTNGRRKRPEKGAKKGGSAARLKTKDGRSASQFIRDLDDSEGELPAAEVVARAMSEQGLELKASLVNNVRTNRRKAAGEAKRKPGRKKAEASEADTDSDEE